MMRIAILLLCACLFASCTTPNSKPSGPAFIGLTKTEVVARVKPTDLVKMPDGTIKICTGVTRESLTDVYEKRYILTLIEGRVSTVEEVWEHGGCLEQVIEP